MPVLTRSLHFGKVSRSDPGGIAAKPGTRAVSRLPAVALAAVLMAGGCSRAPRFPQHLRIYLSADSRGYLEPCGCRRDQAGGLSGRAAVIRRGRDASTVVLDAGSLTPGSRPYDLLKLRYLMEGMRRIGYDAVNLGKTEAELDVNTLSRVVRDSGLPFVSANVVVRKDGSPIAPPYRIVQRGGLRVGITGVAETGDAGPGVEVKPPVQALDAVVPDLRRRCDYLVVLAFTDADTLHEIAEKFHEVDCVLGGDVAQSSGSVEPVNRAILFSVVDRGKVIGQIDLKRSGAGYRASGARGIKIVSGRVGRDAEMDALIARFKVELRDRRYELASAEGMQRIPGQESTADEFVGAPRCQSCHPAAHGVWLASAHAHAFATLVQKGSEYDPDCLRCHTVGYGLYSGFVDHQRTPQLENVQCESCHGRGKDHIRAMQRGAGSLLSTLQAVTPATCTRCHDTENSENFNYQRFWPRIAH